mgnify:CR=1 FL=1
MAATHEAIVHRFIYVIENYGLKYNWGLTPRELQGLWNVDDDTYINGVPLIIDGDYRSGYLVEVVERGTSQVSYLVVVLTPSGHDSAWFEEDAGTFFDRNFDHIDLCRWAVDKIHGLIEGWLGDYAL